MLLLSTNILYPAHFSCCWMKWKSKTKSGPSIFQAKLTFFFCSLSSFIYHLLNLASACVNCDCEYFSFTSSQAHWIASFCFVRAPCPCALRVILRRAVSHIMFTGTGLRIYSHKAQGIFRCNRRKLDSHYNGDDWRKRSCC